MLVIFDCDGVLVDSELMVARAHARALAAAGMPIGEAEVMRRFTGTADPEMYAILEAERGEPFPDAYHPDLKARIAESYRTELRAIDGVVEVLDAIRGPVCVASSAGPEKLRLGLEVTGLHDRFAPHIFSAAQVARGKPAPDLFLLAARTMGFAPADCLVIEDSIPGVQAGRAAGMRVIGFTGGGHCGPGHGERLLAEGAERVVGRMGELKALLAGL